MRLSKSSGLASGEESGYSTSPATPGLTVGSKFNALVETVEEEENEEEEEEEEVVVEEVAVPSGLQSSNSECTQSTSVRTVIKRLLSVVVLVCECPDNM